jgi:hypothetical protein
MAGSSSSSRRNKGGRMICHWGSRAEPEEQERVAMMRGIIAKRQTNDTRSSGDFISRVQLENH